MLVFNLLLLTFYQKRITTINRTVNKRRLCQRKLIKNVSEKNSDSVDEWFKLFDSVVFLGDLNYRTDLSRLEVRTNIKPYIIISYIINVIYHIIVLMSDKII